MQYHFVLWSVILFFGSFCKSSNVFLCKHYYNNDITTLKSNRNDSIRLSVLSTSPYTSFETAQKICDRCLDGGTLVQHDDINQLLPYLPLWIGLTSRPNISKANTNDWTWLDGSELNESEKNYAESIVYPKSFANNVQYGLYAYPNNWNNDNIKYIDRHYKYLDSAEKIANRTGMKWIASRKDVYYDQLDRSASIYNSHLTDEEQWKMPLTRFIVCQRPYRPVCHFWNYTQDFCLMDNIFGCHTYVNMMFHKSDEAAVKCEAPEHRRVAKRCPKTVCTCKVTEWGAWSVCGDEECSSKQTTRTRYRNEVDPNCPGSNIHPSLSEREPCEIPGCNFLLAAGDE